MVETVNRNLLHRQAWAVDTNVEPIGAPIDLRSEKRVSFLAVGGSVKDRTLRTQLLFKNLSDADKPKVTVGNLKNSPYGDDGFFIKPNLIEKAGILSSYDYTVQSYSMNSEGSANVAIIGHMGKEKFGEWNAENKIWVQGGGPKDFNINTDGVAAFNPDNVLLTMGASNCPRFDWPTWTGLMDAWPKDIRDLNALQLGYFVCTRQDRFVHSNASPKGMNPAFACTCPLYRQLNLENELCRNDQWKHKIVMFETKSLNGVKSDHVADVQTAISTLQENSEINTTKKLLEAIYSIHKNHKTSEWEATDFQTITDNVKKLAVDLSSQVDDGGAKSMPMEYDGWTIHNMLRIMKGWVTLSNTDPKHVACHLEFVQHALDRQKAIRNKKKMPYSAYVHELQGVLNGKHLIVLHDLGFDPFNDDWIAINMVLTVL